SMSRKPQASLLAGTAVRIRKHRRRVGSEFGTLIDTFWREDEPWIVLQLPTGPRMAVPVSWTDLPSSQFPRTQAQGGLLPSALLALSQFCRGLRKHLRKRRAPKRS